MVFRVKKKFKIPCPNLCKTSIHHLLLNVQRSSFAHMLSLKISYKCQNINIHVSTNAVV